MLIVHNEKHDPHQILDRAFTERSDRLGVGQQEIARHVEMLAVLRVYVLQ